MVRFCTFSISFSRIEHLAQVEQWVVLLLMPWMLLFKQFAQLYEFLSFLRGRKQSYGFLHSIDIYLFQPPLGGSERIGALPNSWHLKHWSAKKWSETRKDWSSMNNLWFFMILACVSGETFKITNLLAWSMNGTDISLISSESSISFLSLIRLMSKFLSEFKIWGSMWWIFSLGRFFFHDYSPL